MCIMSIDLKRYQCTVVLHYSWGIYAKIPNPCLNLWIVLSPLYTIFFLYIHIFLLTGSTLWLLFWHIELPLSLLLHFWATIKGLLEHKHCDTLTVNLITERATKWKEYSYSYTMIVDKEFCKFRDVVLTEALNTG